MMNQGRDMNPGEAKLLAAMAERRRRSSVLHIEALEGGFVVSIADPDYGPDVRRVVPNVDALLQTVQGWAGRHPDEPLPGTR